MSEKVPYFFDPLEIFFWPTFGPSTFSFSRLHLNFSSEKGEKIITTYWKISHHEGIAATRSTSIHYMSKDGLITGVLARTKAPEAQRAEVPLELGISPQRCMHVMKSVMCVY